MIEQYVSAAELKRLLTSLMAVIGGLLVAGLFAMIVVPGLRNANRPAATAEPSAGSLGWLDPTEYPAAPGYEIPPLDPQTVLTPSPALLARGSELYAQNCASCHGASGQGNGTASAGLKPAPRNFAAAAGWKNGPGLAAVFRTLNTGIAGSAMLSYDYLSKKDRIALAQHVRTLAATPLPDDLPEARSALAKELAAPGERVPNRIPVSLARRKLVEEYRAAPALRDDALSSPLLRRAVQDRGRAATLLAARADWRLSSRLLARGILCGLPGGGFRTEVATFTAEEWRGLWMELLRAAPVERSPEAGGATR